MDVAQIIIDLAAHESPYHYLTRFFDDIFINRAHTALSARPKATVAPMRGVRDAVCDLLKVKDVEVTFQYIGSTGSIVHINSLYPRTTDLKVIEVYFHALPPT